MGFNVFTDLIGIPDPFKGSKISQLFGGKSSEEIAREAAEQVAREQQQQQPTNGGGTGGSAGGSTGGSTWIAGVPNEAVLIGGGVLAFVLLRK